MTAAQEADLRARLDALDLAAFALRHELEAATAETSATPDGAASTNSNVSRLTSPNLDRLEASTA